MLRGGSSPIVESTKKGIPYFVFGKTEKLRHIGNDSVERTDADIPMPGNGYAVSVAVNRQRHSHVAASGSRHTLAIVAGQELCDLIARKVARQLHTAMASSLI